jgi:hypothetical protein
VIEGRGDTMMTRLGRLAAGLLVVAGATAGTSPSAAVRGTPVTTGQFALQLARAAGLTLPATGAERAALEGFGRIGLGLGADPGRALTERTLMQVGQAVGVKVSPGRPDHLVTPAVSAAFVQAIKGPLILATAKARSGAEQVRVSCQGRDSRHGRKGTPASNANPNATAPPCDEEPIP